MQVLNACTIVSKNYLPFARVLAESFHQHQPEGRFFVLLVDRIDGYFNPADEPFEVLEASDLKEIPDLSGFLFKYTILESNTAIKPFLLQFLLREHDLENLVYFDPDICIYSSLANLRALVAESTMVLTPHLDAPIQDDFHPGEQAILQSGAYNLGFLALRHCEETHRLLDWWQQRLYDRCIVLIEEGLFVDQKWMDLAPSLFDQVSILKNPGYNVAYWNLHSRTVKRSNQGPTVNDQPLVFFHFSGIEPESLEGVSKHQDRFRLDQLGDTAELYREYSGKLMSAGFRDCRSWPFAYGVFDNGVAIPPAVRRLYLDLSPSRRSHFGDPFVTAGSSSFWSWLNAPSSRGNKLSRFLLSLYQLRTDIHSRFPEPEGQDFAAFSRWVHEYGRYELRIDPAFLEQLPPPKRGAALSPGSIENRLRRIYRSESAKRLKQEVKRVLGPARSERFKRTLRSPSTEPEPADPTQVPRREPSGLGAIERPGVNLFGYLDAETGMGEAARSIARALAAADIPHSLNSLDLNVLAPNRDSRFRDRAASNDGNPYDLNLLVVNADQIPAVFDHLGPSATAGRFNIGLWLWELSQFPAAYHRSFDYLHEVWTPSSFCVDAFSAVAPRPVRRLPLSVVPAPANQGRQHFGLPEEEYIFLFMFNFLSYFERKNPLGLVEAFRRAFPEDRGVRLVLKTSQSDFAPDRLAELNEAIGELPVTLLDSYYSAEEISSLLATCDAYVSLHRSEGFGLTLAEAMYHGKPVIATGYSGNVDFFDLNNGFPVRYDLVPLAEAAGPYPAGAVWAHPDLDHAASLMRKVREGSEEVSRIAARGASDVRRHLSDQAVGAHLRRAFDTTLSRLG